MKGSVRFYLSAVKSKYCGNLKIHCGLRSLAETAKFTVEVADNVIASKRVGKVNEEYY